MHAFVFLWYLSNVKCSTKESNGNPVLDFPWNICHYEIAMQKVEKWRILELEQVLNRISKLLKEGQNPDWGSVFSHFALEAHTIVVREKFDLDALQRLLRNILACFERDSSLRNLELSQKEPKNREALNKEFRETIGRLFAILSAIEKKWQEQIN